MTKPAWQQIKCGSERWWVAPNWSGELLDRDGLRLQEWTRNGKVEIVKQSLHRTVYRIGLENKPVYIKHYPVNDFRSRIRQWVRHAKAWIEWQRTVMLQERAVPTITPVAVGQHPELGSYLITEEIPDAQPLHAYLDEHWNRWRESNDFVTCNTLIRELAAFLAQMLQAGIVHDDLHAGNVLVHTDSRGQRHWYLIDLYNVQTEPRYDRAALFHMLSLMSQNDWHRLTDNERLRGWLSFRKASGLSFSRVEERLFLVELSRIVHQRIYAVWNQRVRRNTKANRDFYELRVRRCRAWASREIPADWLSAFLFDPDRTLNQSTTRIIKQSRHGIVAVIPGPRRALMIKKFSPRHLADRWLGRWRRSPALHCYRMAYRMQTASLPTANPLAVVERHRHGQLLSSYVLTEYLHNTLPLCEYWPLASLPQRQQALLSLADIIARLHTFRLSHRDLKVMNILARPRQGQSPELYLIDLRGVSHSHWLTRGRKIKDLARLALSAVCRSVRPRS